MKSFKELTEELTENTEQTLEEAKQLTAVFKILKPINKTYLWDFLKDEEVYFLIIVKNIKEVEEITTGIDTIHITGQGDRGDWNKFVKYIDKTFRGLKFKSFKK